MNMISHKQAIRWIDRRLDGLLDESEASLLDRHLDSCESCRAYASEINLLPAQLQNEFHTRWDEQTGPSYKVIEHVTAKAKRIPMTNRLSSGLKLVGGAAALIALAFLINFVASEWRDTSSAAVDGEIATSVPLVQSRLLAFTADQSGNSDIYTVNPDGSGMTNLTNHPAYDSNPVWSPDGTRIAFESDRDGFTQIYLMNADGSDLIQLTKGEVHHFLPLNMYGESNPWSPDGNKLLLLAKESGTGSSTLYSLDLDSGNMVTLANGAFLFINVAWSGDGEYVAYLLNDSPTPDATFSAGLYVVDAAGDAPLAIDLLIPETDSITSPFYYWSRDGNSIVFIAHRHLDEGSDQWIAYEAVVESRQLIERAISSTIMDDWWEGTSFIHGMDLYTLTWLRSDGTFDTFKPFEICDLTIEAQHSFLANRSPNGSQVINIACPNKDMWFYYANPDGTVIKPLMDSPIPSFGVDTIVTSLTWSSDDQFIAATQVSPAKSSLYILNVENPSAQPVEIVVSDDEFYTIPSWRPIGNHEVVEEEPAPAPTQPVVSKSVPPIGTGIANGEWIAFVGSTMVPDPTGSTALTDSRDVYLVRSDGSGLVNLTNSPDYYFWPIWSPNGENLLFLRDIGTIEILRKTESNGFELLVSTEMSAEVNVEQDIPDKPFAYRWSPNSEQIAFLDNRAGNSDIYTIYADGRDDTQLKQLTNDPGEEFGFIWSPDGNQIAYQKTNKTGDQLSVVVMNADGSNQHEVARGAGQVGLRWSRDGRFIYASSTYGWPPYGFLACEGCVTEPAIYQIDLNGPAIRQIYYDEEAEYGWVLYDTPQNGLYFMQIDFDQPSLGLWGTWKQWDGTTVHEIGEMDPQQTCETTTGNIPNEHISPNERFSIITNFCAGGFDLYLADREAATSEERLTHLLKLPLDTLGEGADEAWLPMTWSPDGRFLIYNNGRGATYFLDLENAIQDPSTAPVPFMEPITYTGSDGLQYPSPETITIWDLAWQPAP